MAIKGKNMVSLKQSNRAAILMLLHEQGGMSRKQLAAKLSLTPAAITMLVAELIGDGLLKEGRPLENGGGAGRREILVEIAGASLYAVGISFGIENAILSATDLRGNLLSNETFLFDRDSGANYIISKACSFAAKVINRFGQQGMNCIGVGVSVRGIVSETEGVCENSHGAWPEENVPVRALVEAALPGYSVSLRQNVRALAETYIFENHEEVIESMLLVKNDTGIGAALVINHKIYPGYRSHSAEIGHITIDEHGKPCNCGRRGCLESFSSSRAIRASVAERYGEQTTPALWRLTGGRREAITLDLMSAAIAAGDEAVREIVDRGAGQLGRVLRAQIGVLDMQKVVLHGAIFHDEYFNAQLRRAINFDGHCAEIERVLTVTPRENQLDIKCGPVLAVQAFYARGGERENKQ